MFSVEDIRDKFKDRPHGIQGAKAWFSVVVPIVNINGEPHILYELRSRKIDRQPGEVCFPGGEIEAGETPLQAAIRETWEEIGIPEKDINVIAELDTFHSQADIVIYPFLAEVSLEAVRNLTLSEYEVEECFLVPVSELLEDPYYYKGELKMHLGEDFSFEKIGIKGNDYNWRKMRSDIISWEHEGKYIWGITASITWTLLEILKGKRK